MPACLDLPLETPGQVLSPPENHLGVLSVSRRNSPTRPERMLVPVLERLIPKDAGQDVVRVVKLNLGATYLIDAALGRQPRAASVGHTAGIEDDIIHNASVGLPVVRLSPRQVGHAEFDLYLRCNSHWWYSSFRWSDCR